MDETLKAMLERDKAARQERARASSRKQTRKLDEDKVRAILADQRAISVIAKDYDIAPVLVDMLKKRERWGWLDTEVVMPSEMRCGKNRKSKK